MAWRSRARDLKDLKISEKNKINLFAHHISHTPEDTEKLAQDFAKKLQPGSVLAFFGDLGTGKTTFIRYLAEALSGIAQESVTSPTFQYLNIYSGTTTLYHFDLYRLAGASDFVHMGFDELLGGDGVCCIEWAERIQNILPPETIYVTITHGSEGTRLINIKAIT